jgi:hypothetical protein
MGGAVLHGPLPRPTAHDVAKDVSVVRACSARRRSRAFSGLRRLHDVSAGQDELRLRDGRAVVCMALGVRDVARLGAARP